MAAPARFAIVGNGWRAQFFHRVAAALPDALSVSGVVVRSEQTAERVRKHWACPTYSSVAELVAADRPDFLISSVPTEITASVVEACVALGVPVLAETPPAADVAALRALWNRVGSSGLVQVAEQYRLMPMHAARQSLVRSGVIGAPSSIQLSSTHGYHAVSLIRGLLDTGFEPARVSAQIFMAPLADPMGQRGWNADDRPKPATTTIATIDFGDAMALYDFTDNQWHNQLRSRRMVIRGSLGEISNTDVVRLAAPQTFLESSIVRRQIGYDLDLDGYDTDHISFEGRILWRNPFAGSRFSDEEIAIATLLLGVADWSRGNAPGPYPLADACQDQLIALAIESSLESGATITTAVEAWAGQASTDPRRET